MQPTISPAVIEAITPVEALFAISHLGQVHAESDTWHLRIEGLVERELTLSLADLMRYPKARVESVHHCAGDPLNPTRASRDVANVIWEGVWLRDVLDSAGILPDAQYLWSDGRDHGTFAGEQVEFYRKDVPLDRLGEDVMLATALNGAPLPALHGGPLRLVVPGYYGTNSVKWVWRLTVARERAQSLFTTRFYNDRVEGVEPRPVWALGPGSMIVSPASSSRCTGPVYLRGWAWADREITSVEISGDDRLTWLPASVERRRERAWQSWSMRWVPPARGRQRIWCRATDAAGIQQPADGARNAMSMITLDVSES